MASLFACRTGNRPKPKGVPADPSGVPPRLLQATLDWRQDFQTDLLSAATRRRQRNLELIAVASLLVVVLDLVPTRVSALGVELDDQRGIVWALLILVVGFAAFFIVFALSDLARARTLMDQVQAEVDELHSNRPDRTEWITDLAEGRRQPSHGLVDDINEQVAAIAANVVHSRNRELLKTFGWMRLFMEFRVPLGLAVAAIIALAVRL